MVAPGKGRRLNRQMTHPTAAIDPDPHRPGAGLDLDRPGRQFLFGERVPPLTLLPRLGIVLLPVRQARPPC